MKLLVASLLSLAISERGDWIERVSKNRSGAELVNDLGDRDPLVRESARRELFHQGDPVPLRDLFRREPGDSSWQEWQLALSLLEELGDANDRRRIRELWNHPHPAIREQVARVAGRWPQESQVAIESLLQDPSPTVREALLTELLSHSMSMQRWSADEFHRWLVSSLDDVSWRCRQQALQLLCRSDREPAREAMKARWPRFTTEERRSLLATLVDRPPLWSPASWREVIDAWQPTLADADAQWKLLRAKTMGEVSWDTASVEPLLRVAADKPGVAQSAALELLGTMPRTQSGQAWFVELVGSLRDDPGLAAVLPLAIRLWGPASLDHLQTLARQHWDQPAVVVDILESLSRLPSESTALFLEREIEQRIATDDEPRVEVLGRALVAAARRQPSCAARDRLFLACLWKLSGEARRRAFEQLAEQGSEQHLPLLIDAARQTDDLEVRGRMIQQLASSYGGTGAGAVLEFVLEELQLADSPARSAALSSFAFISLGDRQDFLAEALAAEFRDSQLDRLLIVLAQIGGPVAERVFAEVASNLASPEGDGSLLRFLLRQAAGLRGEPTRQMLRKALEDSRPRIVETALRSLIARRDPDAVTLGERILPQLAPSQRSSLLRDLAALASAESLTRMIESLGLLDPSTDEPTLLAILEYVGPEHQELLDAHADELLEDDQDLSLRLAVLAALGRVGGSAAMQRLAEFHQRFTGSEWTAIFHATATEVTLARGAVLALTDQNREDQTEVLARFFVRQAARRSARQIALWMVDPEHKTTLGDPPIAQRLTTLKGTAGRERLTAALRSLGAWEALLPERFFLATADSMRQTQGNPLTIAWLADRTGQIWPARSSMDLKAQVWTARQDHPPWMTGDLIQLQPKQLQSMEAIYAVAVRESLRTKDEESMFGRTDAFSGTEPRRTLRVLRELASDSQADTFSNLTLERAAREAGNHGRLVAELALLAVPQSMALAEQLGDRALDAAPFDTRVLSTEAWIRHVQGRLPERDRLLEREDRVVASGRGQYSAISVIRRALYRALSDDRDHASLLLFDALRHRPALQAMVEREEPWEPLRTLLSTSPDSRDR